MTQAQIFNLFFGGGNFSKKWLIELSQTGLQTIYLVNNNENVSFGGHNYNVASFEYTQPNNKGEGGTLDIFSADNDVFEFVENADDSYNLRVVGVIAADGSIEQVQLFNHFYGTVSSDGHSLTFNLGHDDRLGMVFTVYKYDTDNNRGNTF